IADSDVKNAFAGSGLGDAGVNLDPTAGGAAVSTHFNYSGTNLAGTAAIYAAPPLLGVTLVAASVNGIPVTSQVAAQLARYGGRRSARSRWACQWTAFTAARGRRAG